MKATAQAPANIAFIKYWGKIDDGLRLPMNSSISMNLSGAYTITTVDFNSIYTQDEVDILDTEFSEAEIKRVIKTLNLIRNKTGEKNFAKVVTKNTFPKGAGSAASASGFAALTVAAIASAGAQLTQKELTVLARIGSGSACRSIPDGFVEWKEGKTSEDSFAYSLYQSDYWDLCDVLVIVDSSMKKVTTTEGMESIKTSPALPERLKAVPDRLDKIKSALKSKNFSALGAIIEEDCLDMHHVMQTQKPPIIYWQEITELIMKSVVDARKQGLEAYFTIDAGPNVHIICEGNQEQNVLQMLQNIEGIQTIIKNRVSKGAQLISDHLF